MRFNTLAVSIFVLNKSSWQNHWPFEHLGLIFYLRPKRTTVWSTGEFFFFFRWAKANIRQEKDGVSHFFHSPHTWLHSFQSYKTIKACPAARRTIYALHQAGDRMSFSLKSSWGLGGSFAHPMLNLLISQFSYLIHQWSEASWRQKLI